MSEVIEFTKDPGKFYIFLVDLIDNVQNPFERDTEFLFDISNETLESYRSLAISAKSGATDTSKLTLPNGKTIKRIVMSRAFEFMPHGNRRILIRIWAHIAMNSAGKGTPPSEEFIEFVAFILRKCPESLLEKSVKAVRGLRC